MYSFRLKRKVKQFMKILQSIGRAIKNQWEKYGDLWKVFDAQLDIQY